MGNGSSDESPTALSNIGNITQNWLKWKKGFLEYLERNNYTDKSEDLKIHLLKKYIGEHGLHAIATTNNCNDKSDLGMLLKKLDIFFEVPESEVVKRYHFFTSSIKENQSIDNYILELQEKAVSCAFGNLTDSLIRDIVIRDIKDKQLQKKLLKTQELNLIKLMSTCHDHEKLKQAQLASSKKKANTTEADTRESEFKPSYGIGNNMTGANMGSSTTYKYTANRSTTDSCNKWY